MLAAERLQQNFEYVWGKFRKAGTDGNLRTRNREKMLDGIVFDPSTGLDNEALKAGVLALAEKLAGQPHQMIKARAFEFVARNVRIDVSPHDWFVSFGCWDRNDRPLNPLIAKWDREVNATRLRTLGLLNAHNSSGAAVMWKDFDHSVPDWDAVFALGFPGIRERARRYRLEREERGEMTPETAAYFDGIDITYGAILEALGRFRSHALAHAEGDARMLACAECLEALVHGPPTNTYEVLQLIYLYFMFSEHIDRYQVRSLGNLDRTLFPYYKRDLAEGRYTEAQLREFIDYFLMQWASIDNYWGQPVYLGGTNADGETEINELSYILLEEYDRLGIYTPKVQLKIARNTPQRFLDTALDMIRRGHNSLVFVGEEPIRRALMGVGVTAEDARNCDITGCYEFSPRGKSNGTCAGHVNLLKPFELIFNGGVDPGTGIDLGCRPPDLAELRTFDDFYAAYLKQLGQLIENVIACANDFEQYLSEISPAQVFSATIETSLERARDAFQDGSTYSFSGILNVGLATAVDALMAVRKYVYERRELTLVELADVLRRNWEGHERLRLKILHDPDKYGNGIDAVDLHAEAIAHYIGNKINLRPTGRGGVYQASLHTARLYIAMGEKTGATPDGRRSGEEMSKNASPTMGMDVQGLTALIRSVTRIDSVLFPGDFPLDVMLHPATAKGEEGLAAMRTLVRTYMDRHGIAIHFNVMDAETLVRAQEHPDQYQGLQLRVCGWNVNFTELSRREQDMYILRARNIAE